MRTALAPATLILGCLLSVAAESPRVDHGKPAPPATYPAEYRSVEQIIHTVPAKLFPARASEWTDLKLEAVNDVLKVEVIGQMAALPVTVQDVGENSNFGKAADEERYKVSALQYNAGETPVWVWCFFTEKEKATLAALSKGDKIKVSGKVWHCRFHRDGSSNRYPIDINLTDCRIVADK